MIVRLFDQFIVRIVVVQRGVHFAVFVRRVVRFWLFDGKRKIELYDCDWLKCVKKKRWKSDSPSPGLAANSKWPNSSLVSDICDSSKWLLPACNRLCMCPIACNEWPDAPHVAGDCIACACPCICWCWLCICLRWIFFNYSNKQE